MIEDPISGEQTASSNSTPTNALALFAWVVFAMLMALLGYWLGTRQSAGPGTNSPEAGFARDMMMHHAQAVDMATLLRDRTEDPDLRQIALDIVLTQQAQIGQMQGWLAIWGVPIARTGPAMEWMGMPTSGPMPGMATPEQMNQLRSLSGEAADILFLQLMIPHHASGVEMAQVVLDRAREPAVRNLAQSIVDAQTSEIEMMQALLQQKGQPPVPVEEGGGHGSGNH